MTDKKTIGYQGALGSYSYQASNKVFPDQDYKGHRFFHQVFTAVEQGDVDYAMIPVENSTAGRVMEIYNLLPESDIQIVGEYLLPINHCLLIPRQSVPDLAANGQLTPEQKSAILNTITEVHSHPQAIAQCRKYIAKNIPNAVGREEFDTAGATRDIAPRTDYKLAALASESAGEVYDMITVEKGVEDCEGNTTRFIILAKDKPDLTQIKHSKDPLIVTLLFETHHTPGSLLEALYVFKKFNINLLKLETYMANHNTTGPQFYVDLNASNDSNAMEDCMKEFENHAKNIKILGIYPASKDRGNNNSFLQAE